MKKCCEQLIIKKQVNKRFFKAFLMNLKRGKQKEMSQKRSFHHTIVQSLAIRHSNDLSFSFCMSLVFYFFGFFPRLSFSLNTMYHEKSKYVCTVQLLYTQKVHIFMTVQILKVGNESIFKF